MTHAASFRISQTNIERTEGGGIKGTFSELTETVTKAADAPEPDEQNRGGRAASAEAAAPAPTGRGRLRKRRADA